MLTTAIKIAATAFEKDYDKGGTPYIMHLLYVMHKVKHLGEVAMITKNIVMSYSGNTGQFFVDILLFSPSNQKRVTHIV